LWMRCHSGMHSNKAAKRTLAQLIDSTELVERLSGGPFAFSDGTLSRWRFSATPKIF
jgi:hypothetical protein